MQAQATLNQYRHEAQVTRVEPGQVAATVADWLTRVFGCWHAEMSRPFTREGESYRACLDCGAHRKFDPVKWEMIGVYYYSAPRFTQ